MSESLADILTFEDSVPRVSWADTYFLNQLLYLLEINALAGLLKDISKSWNLLIRLCGRLQLHRNFHHKTLLGCNYHDL